MLGMVNKNYDYLRRNSTAVSWATIDHIKDLIDKALKDYEGMHTFLCRTM